MPQKVWLDTDIGDDVDDALALALLLASPELTLLGISTVFGNTAARARQARTLLQIAGGSAADVPVTAGCGASLASRPHDNMIAYLEDRLPNQDPTCLPETELRPLDPRHGVATLIQTLQQGDGDILPITIGAMTNLAVALTVERRIAARIPRIVAMAGEFKRPFAEWNIGCDPEAAHLVFASEVPVDITPWDIGNAVRFTPEHLVRLEKSARPVARSLFAAIRCWQDHLKDSSYMPRLYDPLAIATLVAPHLVVWRQGRVSVELQGSRTYGFTHFAEDPTGPHRVAWEVDREGALDFYLSRVLSL